MLQGWQAMQMFIFAANYKSVRRQKKQHKRPQVGRQFSDSAGAQCTPKLLIGVVVGPVN